MVIRTYGIPNKKFPGLPRLKGVYLSFSHRLPAGWSHERIFVADGDLCILEFMVGTMDMTFLQLRSFLANGSTSVQQ